MFTVRGVAQAALLIFWSAGRIKYIYLTCRMVKSIMKNAEEKNCNSKD